ncbi:MAG: hypothetical protein ACP5H2_01970 [Solirubrobacteraceae bacterium]
MTPTLRRLNDRERYWGLTWPAWIAVAIAGGMLYGAVRVSPLGVKATITLVVLILAFSGMVIAGVSGQALSPGRQLAAIVRYHRAARRYRLPDVPDKRGLVLDRRPPGSDPPGGPEGFGEVLA